MAVWLEAELAAAGRDEAFVVHHSAVWLYLEEDERRRIRERLEARGAVAPLAWLRHEHRDDVGPVEIRLDVWPGGESRVLARGHPHGRRVRWQPDADPEEGRSGPAPRPEAP